MGSRYIQELTDILDHKKKTYRECEEELKSGGHSRIVIAALRLYQYEAQRDIDKFNKILLYARQSKGIS